MSDLLRDVKDILSGGYVSAMVAARDAIIAAMDRQIKELELRKVQIALEYAEAIQMLRPES